MIHCTAVGWEPPLGDTGLPSGRHDPGDEARCNQQARGHRGPVSAHELAGSIADGVGPGRDRTPFQVAPEIL